MGDISAEPSMEEILSSIKRIIAEEGEGMPQRPRRPQRTPVPVDRDGEPEEVLELREPMPLGERPAAPVPQPFRAPEPAAVAPPVARAPEQAPLSSPQPAPPRVDPIVSQQAAAASRGSLDALTRLIVKPEAGATGDNTLEGLVREMLRPMLREWLDARLPDMVETMVAREIERITGTR